MAEEEKQEEKKLDIKKSVSFIVKFLLGLAFLALGIVAIFRWWPYLLVLVKGSIGLFLILAAMITLAIAKD